MLPADARSGRCVVITGALGGIGLRAAESFSRDGWRVIGIDVKSSDESRVFSEQHVCDLADDSAIDAVVSELQASGREVECLVNCAGLTKVAPSATLAASDWDLVHDVSLRGTFLISRAMLPMLIKANGSIVNLSSISAQRLLPGRAAYSSAKAGLDALTRSLAIEWAPSGVRVNAVAPAWVDNDFLRSLAATGALDPAQLAAAIPMGRLCSESDVVEAIRFLADSNRAGFITGQVLYVDGGYLHAG